MIELFIQKPWLVLGVACVAIPAIAVLITLVIIKIEDHLREKRIEAICDRYRLQREKDEKEHKEFMQRYSFGSRRL